jgi:hypothetical protein
MPIGKTWAGRLFGTHTGNISVKLFGEDRALSGVLRHNDPGFGITVYKLTGSFAGSKLVIEGTTDRTLESVEFPPIKATAVLQQVGSLEGDWESASGAGGNFTLWPHDGSRGMPADVAVPDQLHTARHQFGPIAIELPDIIGIADDIQKELPRARIVVTFDTGTEQSRYLPDFKEMKFSAERASLLKIHGAEPDPSGIDRVLSVEFGQNVNVAMAQGVSRSWSLGALESLKRIVQRHQRGYAKAQYGNIVTRFILLGTIVALPSMDSLSQRAVLMLFAALVVFSINRIHDRYLPNAAVYLGEKAEGPLYKSFQFFGIWFIGAIGSTVVLLVGAYLKGLLSL